MNHFFEKEFRFPGFAAPFQKDHTFGGCHNGIDKRRYTLEASIIRTSLRSLYLVTVPVTLTEIIYQIIWRLYGNVYINGKIYIAL